MNSIKLPALFLSTGIALSGFFIAYALSDSRAYNRYVQVKGLSEKMVKADKAIWSLRFRFASNELSDLYQGVAMAQNQIRQFLVAQGFVANEISIAPVSVTDNQSTNYNSNQKAKRFSADAGVTVATSKVDRVQDSVQKTGYLVKKGVIITGSNANYRFTHLNEIKPQMLNDATLSAQTAGQSFASQTDAQLGSIRNARQGVFTITDANSQYNSGSAIMKKVRIVTTVEFFLK